MADTLIYEGPVTIYTTNQQNQPLTFTPQRGNDAGVTKPYCKVAFPWQGQTLYLPDFTNYAAELGPKPMVKLAFEQEFLPAVDAFTPAQPKLYPPNDPNGKPQYKLLGIQPVGGAPAQPQQQLQQQAAVATNTGGKAYDPGLGSYQTALNVSGTIMAALIKAGAISPEGMDIVQVTIENADRFHRYLVTGKADELDAFLEQKDEVKDKLGATELPPDDPDADIPY